MDPSSRAAIDRFKEEHRRKEWEKLKKLEAEKYSSIKGGRSLSESKDQQYSIVLELSAENGQDFSRRSSLKSTILDIGVSRSDSPGPSYTENPLASILRRDSSDKKKP